MELRVGALLLPALLAVLSVAVLLLTAVDVFELFNETPVPEPLAAVAVLFDVLRDPLDELRVELGLRLPVPPVAIPSAALLPAAPPGAPCCAPMPSPLLILWEACCHDEDDDARGGTAF